MSESLGRPYCPGVRGNWGIHFPTGARLPAPRYLPEGKTAVAIYPLHNPGGNAISRNVRIQHGRYSRHNP